MESLVAKKAQLGEGPCWHEQEQVLYWVDILGKSVRRYDPQSGEDLEYPLEERVGTVAPRREGGLLLGLETGFAFFNPVTGALDRLPAIEPSERTRFNDGKCDRRGRFWCGSMDLDEREAVGVLYRLDADLTVKACFDKVTVSNGMTWSLDERVMYYIDSPTRAVYAFDFDSSSGEITRQRTAFTFSDEEGFPDGMTIDEEGMLWIAHWGGARVTRRDPQSGHILQRVDTPAPHTTACCFGGPERRDLYITSAREGLSKEALDAAPESGGLFRVRLAVAGEPTYAFAD